MDKKALYQLSYGVFVLTTRTKDRMNGCITNTCMQVANSPARVAISVLNTNYTCDLIKESGVFAVSVLDETCNFQTIKYFGMQSGRDVNKFIGFDDVRRADNGILVLSRYASAYISLKLVRTLDLGSHTLFIAELEDAQVLSDLPACTYGYYQSDIKPKPQPEKKKGWVCSVCGHVYEGEELPEDYVCPLCRHGREDFQPISQ